MRSSRPYLLTRAPYLRTMEAIMERAKTAEAPRVARIRRLARTARLTIHKDN